MVMEVTEEVDLKSNEDDIIAALKKYSVLCPDDEDRGGNEARTELCKPEDAAGDPICGEAVAGCSVEGKDVRISQSHSKKVIKHALRQQAKRRRKNTTIASGSSEHVVVKSAGLDAGHVPPCPAPQPTLPRPGMATMREVLASIPGFSVKPRRRSSKKLSTAAQLEQTKEGCVDLETPDSILAGTNLRLLLNKHTFSALPPLYQYKLVQLLPAVDQADMSLRLSSSGLNNEFFARACLEWNERLSEGEFTPENQQRLKAEAEREMSRLDPWKLKHFEPIWGERHESYTFDGGSCTDNDRLKSGMKLRASAAAGRPAPRARTVGAVTRAITSCRDEPPAPPPRHKRHADNVNDELAKKPKPEPCAEPVATTVWDGQDAVDTPEDDPFAPSDRFNDSDHSAYEPTVEHADDVIHESAILRPPLFSSGADCPSLHEARLQGPEQKSDDSLLSTEKWTNQQEDDRVSETRQVAVWTNQDEDERISAVPEEWSQGDCPSEGINVAGHSKVPEDSIEMAHLISEAVNDVKCQLQDSESELCTSDTCGPVQTKLEDFKMVQSKLAEFEAAQTKLAECEIAQAKLPELNTAQTKLAELKTAQAKLAEFEIAQTKLEEINAAQVKLAEFETAHATLAELKAAQTKLAKFEATQAKLAEFEANQTNCEMREAIQSTLVNFEETQTTAEIETNETNLGMFEVTQSVLAKLEATQTKLVKFEETQAMLTKLVDTQTQLAEFEANQAQLATFENTQAQVSKLEDTHNNLAVFEENQVTLVEFEANQANLAKFEAPQTTLAKFEAARTKLAEFEATQTKLVKFKSATSNHMESEASHSKCAGTGLSRPPFEVTQTRLVDFDCEEPGNLEMSPLILGSFQSPDLSSGLVAVESKTSDLEESQDGITASGCAPPLNDFSQSHDFGQIRTICQDLSQTYAITEDSTQTNVVSKDFIQPKAISEDFIQTTELDRSKNQLERIVLSDSHLEHFEQENNSPEDKCDARLDSGCQATDIGDIDDTKLDFLNESTIKEAAFIGLSEINKNFQQETGRVELIKQSVSNSEDCTQTDNAIDEFSHSQSDLVKDNQVGEEPECYVSTINLLDFKSEGSIDDFRQSTSNVEDSRQTGSSTDEFSETSNNVDELGQPRSSVESYNQEQSNVEDFSQQTSNIEADQPISNDEAFSQSKSNLKVVIQPNTKIDGFSQISDVAVEHYDGSAEMEAALRLAVSREWETKCVGEVKVIPMHEELEVRLEEGSFPVERDLNTMNWYPVATDGGGAGNSTGETATGEAYASGQALKLELEVTLTPEASTMGGPPMSVIPPTTIVCLPSLVVSSPHLATPGGGCNRPASSSAVPYLALSGATPLRALTQLHKPGMGGGSAIGGKHKQPRDSAQGSTPGGRNSRGVSNRPPPGAVNLERSYQICQAVIQNSPNRDQLRAQLKPPPPLLTGPKRTGGPPHPGLVTGTKGTRALPHPGPRAAVPTPTRSALYDRPLRLPSPPPPPPGLGAGVVRHVFTSAHGIPVTMAVLPQGAGGGPQEVTIAPDAMGGGGQYILVHRPGEPDMQLAGRRNPGPPRASSAPPANRNMGAGGIRPMGGRGRPASVDVRQEYVCPPERYLVACPSPGTQAVSRRKDVSQHGMSYADVGDAAAPSRPDLSMAPRTAPRPSFSAVGGTGFATQCGCNARPMVVCRKCGAFCHDDCVSPASICGSCLVR